MGSVAMLDAVGNLLANDATFLAFGGLDLASTSAQKAAFIVKEEETDGVVTSATLPIVMLYTRPGHKDVRSTRVYIGKVVIDCYAKTGYQARQMGDRTLQLMQGWEAGSNGLFVALLAYETSFKTGIPGVKGHRFFYDISEWVG